jgi:hypothetical protein
VASGLAVALLFCGCGTYPRRGVSPDQAHEIEQRLAQPTATLSPELKDKILALDPNHVTRNEVRAILSQAPAPRVISVHGGVRTVIWKMVSFADFLMGMGYPGLSLTNAADGTYTVSCYESSKMIAGSIAWYYEKEGLRPVMVGHSQGAMQIVKVLHKLDGPPSRKIAVWNPLTWEREPRHEIKDPLTGEQRPVVGLTVPYATGMGGGGLTRLLPNQWDMCGRLRTIPDTVEEYTYFYKGMDLLGGDFLGYGPANLSQPKSRAAVRNVRLPTWYHHGAVPNTRHLVESQAIMDWIDDFDPMDPPATVPEFDSDSLHILWAADVWYSLKKHWVLELQRWIRARDEANHAD